MKNIILVFIFLATGVLGQANQRQKGLLNYAVILNAQKTCNGKELSKIPFAENRRAVFSLAKKAIVVVSDLSLKEVSRHAKPVRGTTRDFVLKYRLYAQLACNHRPNIFDNGRGISRIELPVIEHAWHDPQHIAVVTDSGDEDIEKPSLIVQFTANDLPPEPGVNGLACIVTQDQFLTANPKELAKRICGNEASQAARQATAISIRQVQSAIRKAK